MPKVNQETTLIVVVLQGKIICVYLNGERISGRKPSPIEGAVYLEKVISKDSIINAIGDIPDKERGARLEAMIDRMSETIVELRRQLFFSSEETQKYRGRVENLEKMITNKA